MNLNKILILIITILVVIIMLPKCSEKPIKIDTSKSDSLLLKIKNDSMLIAKLTDKQKIDSLRVLASKHKEDSIKSIADKYASMHKISSKKVRELLAKGIVDTALVEVALNDCDSTINKKDILIAQKDSTYKAVNEELSTVKEALTICNEVNKIAKNVISNNDAVYDAKEKALKKKSKRNIVYSFLIGIGSGLLINILN